jgi:hypothetical protein
MDNSGKTETIVKRILKEEEKISMVFDLLVKNIEPTDLQSLLIALYEKLVKRMDIKNIMNQYRRNRFVKLCDLSQKELLKFDNLIYDAVSKEFESVELSPVSPLGTNSILTKINQKNILSTIRNIEVVADVTMFLALECARRRNQLLKSRPRSSLEINLCTSHRCIRLQKFTEDIGFTPHFRVFGACTEGRDVGYEKFESENLIKHVGIYLDLLEIANKSGYFSGEISVSFSDIRVAEKIIRNFRISRKKMGRNTQTKEFDLFDHLKINFSKSVSAICEIPIKKVYQYQLQKIVGFLSEIEQKAVKVLKIKYPKVHFQFDLKRIAGIGYYEALCFKIVAKNKFGQEFPLADGGLTDWTKKLLSSKKERLFTSGFGSELFCRNFKA